MSKCLQCPLEGARVTDRPQWDRRTSPAGSRGSPGKGRGTILADCQPPGPGLYSRKGIAVSDDLTTRDVFQQVDSRLTRVEEDLRQLRADTNAGFARLDLRIDQFQQGLTQRMDESQQGHIQRLDESQQGLTQRMDESHRSLTQRLDESQQGLTQRMDESHRSLTQRMDESYRSLTQRLDESQQGLTQRLDESHRSLVQRMDNGQRDLYQRMDQLQWRMVGLFVVTWITVVGSIWLKQ